MQKVICLILVLVISFSYFPRAEAYGILSGYLCELGVKFYNEGRYQEALQEFNKAILIERGYKPALRYIRKIKELGISLPEKAKAIKKTEINQKINLQITNNQEIIGGQRDVAIETIFGRLEKENKKTAIENLKQPVKKPIKAKPAVITLDEFLAKARGPLEIEQGRDISLYVNGIQRFLATEPDIITLERKSANEVSVAGKNLGYTYLYIWDAGGRHTVEFLVVPSKPAGESLEEQIRRRQTSENNFKLTYSLDWSSFNTGRRLNQLERANYYFIHTLGLQGPTPYGDLDALLSVNKYNQNLDVVHYTLGLSNAKLGDFNNFNIRAFDFFDVPPSFSNLSFPGTPLRGLMFFSPAFNNKLDYTLFYGRENWSGFAGLSPSLDQQRDAYLEGFNINFTPSAKQNYKFTLVHGSGKDRSSELKPFGYDLVSDWILGKWRLNYEAANDSKKFANLFNLRYVQPNLAASMQLRDINREFTSITGSGWSQGQLGSLLTFNYNPIKKLEIYSSLDLYQDRLYPANAGNERLNEDFNLNSVYRIDPLTQLSMNYILQNELARISRYRYQSIEGGLNRDFKFYKDINSFIKFYHQENTNFSSPSSDYINEKIYGGLKINLNRDLYYYANAEINWLKENFTGDKTNPSAFETGLNYSGQIAKTPFFNVSRVTYRDEEDTSSNLSFLSGEDYIEGYSELSYRPSPDTNIYGSVRLRNVWADNPNVIKRIEAAFNAGLRFVWDTGLNWQAVGDIYGYVFKDLNSNGLRDDKDTPVEKVKVWLAKARSTLTDKNGYYIFKKVRGNQINVGLDTATIPSGFVLTVPANQLAQIRQHQATKVDFGITSRSEIYGYIFEDVSGKGQLDKASKGLRNVTVMLKDGSKSATDNSGRYSFSNISPGEHTITLLLETLPVYYLPKTALSKKITLFEGVAYNYNIPLSRSNQQD